MSLTGDVYHDVLMARLPDLPDEVKHSVLLKLERIAILNREILLCGDIAATPRMWVPRRVGKLAWLRHQLARSVFVDYKMNELDSAERDAV